MNILYLHGYGSEYKPDSDKVKALENIGSVSGLDLDYGMGPTICIESAVEACMNNDIDLIVGTSMGGWLASHSGARCGIPFVALNPATDPGTSLKKQVDQVVNYTATSRTIDAQTVELYPPIATNGCGLILCEEGDEIVDPKVTIDTLTPHYEVHVIPGGTHRFESLASQLPKINHFVHISELVYGLDTG